MICWRVKKEKRVLGYGLAVGDDLFHGWNA